MIYGTMPARCVCVCLCMYVCIYLAMVVVYEGFYGDATRGLHGKKECVSAYKFVYFVKKITIVSQGS